MIKLAVFDMAGTTVVDNNFVGQAFQQAFSNNGFEIALADFNHLMGYHKPTAIRMVLDKIGNAADDTLIATIHTDFQNGMLDFYKNDPEVKPIPEAEDIFLQLKDAGVRIALNTGFSREIADRIVTRFQWKERGLIDDYIASDEVEQGRPQTFMMEQLMERAGISDTTQVAKIGDTEVDINEGRNAGCGLVVAVTTGAYTREELAAFNPDHILDSLNELPELIRMA